MRRGNALVMVTLILVFVTSCDRHRATTDRQPATARQKSSPAEPTSNRSDRQGPFADPVTTSDQGKSVAEVSEEEQQSTPGTEMNEKRPSLQRDQKVAEQASANGTLANDEEREGTSEPSATLPVAVDRTSEGETVSALPWPPAHRLFLPTTAGPLLIDAEIRLGDELLSDAFTQRIDELLEAADGDSDGEPTWEDWLTFVANRPELFGRQSGFTRGQYRQLIRRFDRNRNKRPDRQEAARFLFRNSGVDAPFRLLGTAHYREINRSESVLFKAIDANDDGKLDEAEIAAAPRALTRFDPNADQRIDLLEVIRAEQDEDAWDRRQSNRRGEVAMDLDGYVDWTMAAYSMESLLHRRPFSLTTSSIEPIDSDGDGVIAADEARKLRDVPPDLRLKVTFPAESPAEPGMEVVWMRSDLHALNVSQHSPANLSMFDDSFTLLLSAIDRQAIRNRIPREAFDMLDMNDDGFLEKDEIPDAASQEFSLQRLDADGDGKLTFAEVNSTESGPRPVWDVQVRARGAEFPDGLFVWLDANHDRYLSTRELLGADVRLQQIRRDEQPIQPADIPDSFAIRFMHADPMQDPQNFRFDSPTRAPLRDWPVWAKNMDVNRDGEISELEFPGSAKQFQELDNNSDRFVDADEIVSFVAADGKK